MLVKIQGDTTDCEAWYADCVAWFADCVSPRSK